MTIRLLIVCIYLTCIYWTSSHIAVHNMLFYPTLGAFSYFFVSRNMSKENIKIVLAAVTGVTCGSVLHVISSGIITFSITCLAVIAMLRILHLHAAPVVGVSLIPFFSKTPSLWILPVSILCSLSGLLLVLWGAQLLEEKWAVVRKGSYPSRGRSLEETL